MTKKILILANHDVGLYNFRKELLERFLLEGHKVYISCPQGDNIKKIIDMGCHYIETHFKRHGTNPFNEIKLLNFYRKIIKDINPDIIFGYTVKPNIYGALAAKKNKTPFVANITGLGKAVEKTSFLQGLIINLYKYAFTNVQTVFFQNKDNLNFFTDKKIALNKHELLPGSGVNLQYFNVQDYPTTNNSIEFVFISRIMKEKGIEQYLKAAQYIVKKYPNVKFHICGFCEDNYEELLRKYQDRGIIIYHGMVNDVRKLLKKTHCTIHPTFYPEGLSNVLLESAASGRPIITTDRSGTRETVDDGITGYLIKEKDVTDLIKRIEGFIELSFEDKMKMGIKGREKIEKKFDRQIVVNKYINELNKISEDKK